MWQVGFDMMLTEDQIVKQKKMKYMLFFCMFFSYFFSDFYNLREVCRIFCPIDQDVLLKQVKLLRWFSFPGGAVFDENL